MRGAVVSPPFVVVAFDVYVQPPCWSSVGAYLPPDVLDDVPCADTMFSILETAFGFGFWSQVWFVKVVQTAREVFWILVFGLLCRHSKRKRRGLV